MKKLSTSNNDNDSSNIKKTSGLGRLALRALSERTNRPTIKSKKESNNAYKQKNLDNEKPNISSSINIESSYTNWINFMLVSYNDSLFLDAPSGRITPKKITEVKKRNLISFRAKKIYDEGSKTVFINISNSIQQGNFKIGSDKHLYVDLGLRESFLNLLFSYNSSYLLLALETLFARKFNSGVNGNIEQLLRKIILHKILRNKSIEKKYSSCKFKEEKIKYETDQYIVKTFLELIWCLDKFKLDNLIEGICLFNKDSLFKDSNQILCQFTKDYLSGEGDTILSLNYLGYKLTYAQTALDEYDFTVYNLSHDLRDGIRLAKLAESISNLNQLGDSNIMKRVNTSDTKFRKIQNVKIALEVFHQCGIPVSDINAKDIVSGHRSQTLKLLWRISYASVLPSVIDLEVLKDEIERIKFINYTHNKKEIPKETSSSEPCTCLGFSKDLFTSLLHWCQSIGEFYGYPIYNFTESFADLKAICYIISFYTPETINLEKIHEDNCLSEIEKLKKTYELMSVAIEQIGFVPLIIKLSDFMSKSVEEKLMIMFLSYLCSRLINIQHERRSAIIIQRAFRIVNKGNMEKRKFRNITTLQRFVKGFIERNKFVKYKQHVIIVQSLIRKYLNYQNERKVKSIVKIQSCIRSFLIRKELKEKKDSIIRIQSFIKSIQLRSNFIATKQSAVLIQALIRRFLADKKIKNLKKSSIIIQSFYRSIKQRQHFNNIKNAITIIQAAFRSHQQQKYYQELKKSCIMIQSLWRFKSTRNDYLKRRNAIITIQKFYSKLQTNQKKIIATITIQSMIRAFKERSEYNCMKNSVILIQNYYRRIVEQRKKEECIIKIQSFFKTMKQMDTLNKLKESCLSIQSIVRRNNERKRFNQLKQSTIIIQKHIREYISRNIKLKAAKQILKVFNMVKAEQEAQLLKFAFNRIRNNYYRMKSKEENAVILIQSFFRMASCRMIYQENLRAIRKAQAIIRARNSILFHKQLKEAAIIIQSCARAYLQQSDFKKYKQSSMKIQSLYRMYVVKKQFDAQKKAILLIQRQLRKKIEEKKCLNAILLIQSMFRASQERERFAQLKRSVICLQKSIKNHFNLKQRRTCLVIRLQSLIKMYLERHKYQQKRESAIIIQKAWRGYQSRLETLKNTNVIKLQAFFRMFSCKVSFLHYKHNIIKLQSFIKMKQQRDHYLSMRQAVLTIQNRYRLNKKIEKSTMTLQKAFRMFLEREKYRKLKDSVILLQTFYRQHIAQNNTQSKSLLKPQDKSETLGTLTHFALNDLLSSKNLTLIVNRCSTLELSTRYSEVCALSCLDYKVIPILFNLMNDCNRSAPHIKLLKSLLSILINIASYKDKTCPNILSQKEDAFNVLSILLTKFKDVPEVFCPAAKLLKTLYPYKQYQNGGLSLKKMNALLNHLIKKEQMDIKSKKHEIILKKTRKCIKLLKDVINTIEITK